MVKPWRAGRRRDLNWGAAPEIVADAVTGFRATADDLARAHLVDDLDPRPPPARSFSAAAMVRGYEPSCDGYLSQYSPIDVVLLQWPA
jgi:hypothetical protein